MQQLLNRGNDAVVCEMTESLRQKQKSLRDLAVNAVKSKIKFVPARFEKALCIDEKSARLEHFKTDRLGIQFHLP